MGKPPLDNVSVADIRKDKRDLSPNITKLIDILDFEIDRINVELSRPGWTHWAMLGGIASALWLLSIELEKHQVSILNTAFLFLVINIAYDNFISINGLLASIVDPTKGPRFASAYSLLSQSRSFMLISLSRLIVIIALLQFTIIHTYGYYVYVLEMVYILYAFTLIALFSISFTTIPFPVGRTKRKKKDIIFAAALVAALTYALYSMVYFIYNNRTYFALTELRVSALIMVVTILLLKIADKKNEYLLLPKLIDIRRDILLDKISAENAKKQIEIALIGLGLTDIVQKEVLSILEKYEIANNSLELFESHINDINKDIDEKHIDNAKVKTTELMMKLDSPDNLLRKVKENITDIRKELPKLVLKLRFTKQWSEDTEKEAVVIGEMIMEQLKKVDERVSNVLNSLMILKDKIRLD